MEMDEFCGPPPRHYSLNNHSKIEDMEERIRKMEKEVASRRWILIAIVCIVSLLGGNSISNTLKIANTV